MGAVNPQIKFWLVIIIFAVIIVFFGVTFGVVINNVDLDNYNNNVKIYSGIAWTSLACISALGLISFYGISQDPSIFGPYVLIVTHLSLLLSILAVTFSTFNVKTT